MSLGDFENRRPLPIPGPQPGLGLGFRLTKSDQRTNYYSLVDMGLRREWTHECMLQSLSSFTAGPPLTVG